MRSSSAAVSSRSTPGCSPSLPNVVGWTGWDFCLRLRLASLSRRASSIMAVTVVRDSAASFLSWIRRSSGKLIVVLIHQSISYRHIDVKLDRPNGRSRVLASADEGVPDGKPGESAEVAVYGPQFPNAMKPAQRGDPRIMYLGACDTSDLERGAAPPSLSLVFRQ